MYIENLENLVKVLKNASIDCKIKSLDFRILSYIAYNKGFILKDIKIDLKISSYNTFSKSLKNLFKNNYILKQKTNKKFSKNVSSYNYLVNINKMNIPNISINTIEPILIQKKELMIYFFEKLPTTKKIDYFNNSKAFEHLILIDKIDFKLIFKLIDFVANNEDLKNRITRPTLLRKNLNLILELFNIQKIKVTKNNQK